MNGRPAPRWISAWLVRQPLLLSDWIALRNRISRFVSRGILPVTGLVFAVVALMASVLLLLNSAGRSVVALIDRALAYTWLVSAIAGLYALSTVMRRRRRLDASFRSSWLVAVSIESASVRRYVAARVVGLLTLQALALQLIAGFVIVASDAATLSVLRLSALLMAGLATGSLAGWYWPAKNRPQGAEASRYVPKPSASRGLSMQPLSRWPIVKALSWSRPENARMLLVIALLSVQAGSSIIGGLSVISVWFLAAYLAGLLQATVQVARQATVWLRSTSITFVAFAWSVARRAILHQVIGTFVGAAVLIALGSPLFMALYLAAVWLALVVLVISISLADSYRNRPSGTGIALSVAAMTVIEARQQYWSIPLALLMTFWHLRKGARA